MRKWKKNIYTVSLSEHEWKQRINWHSTYTIWIILKWYAYVKIAYEFFYELNVISCIFYVFTKRCDPEMCEWERDRYIWIRAQMRRFNRRCSVNAVYMSLSGMCARSSIKLNCVRLTVFLPFSTLLSSILALSSAELVFYACFAVYAFDSS